MAEPHIGSSKPLPAGFFPASPRPECCRGNIFSERRHPVESVTATVEAIPTEIDAEHKATLAQARKNANIGLLQVDRGTSHAFLTKLIDNRVLDALRAELCVPHIGAAPAKSTNRELVAARCAVQSICRVAS